MGTYTGVCERTLKADMRAFHAETQASVLGEHPGPSSESSGLLHSRAESCRKWLQSMGWVLLALESSLFARAVLLGKLFLLDVDSVQ